METATLEHTIKTEHTTVGGLILPYEKVGEYYVEELGDIPAKPVYGVIKRVFDIIASLAALVLLIIPMIIIAFVVCLDSPGPAFYVQDRLGLNASRMRRQRTYFAGFQKSARAALNSDSELAMKLVGKLSDYMVTDMTADGIGSLAEKLDKYEIGEVRFAKGDNIQGKEFYEFYVDKDDLWKIVQEQMCTQG